MGGRAVNEARNYRRAAAGADSVKLVGARVVARGIPRKSLPVQGAHNELCSGVRGLILGSDSRRKPLYSQRFGDPSPREANFFSALALLLLKWEWRTNDRWLAG